MHKNFLKKKHYTSLLFCSLLIILFFNPTLTVISPNLNIKENNERIKSSSLTTWNERGAAICNFSGDQNMPSICADGIGGAMIA